MLGMKEVNQLQKAGKDSQQIQISNLTINEGITGKEQEQYLMK